MNSTIARATGLGIGIGLVTVTTVAASTTPPPTQEEMVKIEQPVLIESVPPLDEWHCDALGCTPERPEDRPPLTPQEQADVDAEGEQPPTVDVNGDTDTIGEAQETAPEYPNGSPGIADGELIYEDDPRWDCRDHGNRECGVLIHDVWYVVTFDDFGPAAVRVR